MKSPGTFLYLLAFLLFCTGGMVLFSDVKSSRGYVDFFPNDSGDATGRLDSQARLGLGTTSPSANLHVSGNGIITEQLIIGGSTGSGNLFVHGSYGFSNYQSVSSNITLSGNSRLMVSSSTANIFLTLPDPATVPGWIYSLKVIDDTFETDIGSLAGIDGDATIRMNKGNTVKPSIELVNDGTAWYVLETTGFTPNRFWLLDHDAGQESNSFSGRTFERQVEVFAFKLYPTIETTNVDSLTFVVSGNLGISGADLSDFKLFIDSDASGNIDGAEATEIGGTPTVDFSANTITFDGDFSVGGDTKYILKGDFVNLYWQDSLTLSMGAGNVSATKIAMGGVDTNAVHTTPYSLLIIEPTAGQEENIINNFPTSATSQEFFSFRIDPNGDGTDITVTRLELTLENVEGWTSSDLTNVRLYIDENANGAIDAGETTFVGGVPTINISSGTGNIVFTSSWTVTSAGNDIITVGDFANLDKLSPGDVLTTTLSELNMSAGNNVFGGPTDLKTSTAVQSVGGDTQLYYSTSDAPINRLRQRFFNDTTGTWNDNLLTATGNTTVYWVVNQVSRTSPRQFIAAQSDDGTARLDMMTYDGTSYLQSWNSSALDAADESKRLFDMEIEALTGNAIIVYSEGGSDPVYRKYTGSGPDGGWTAAASVFGGSPPTAGQVEWIELVRQSGSNEVALAYVDDTDYLVCTIWDGSSWDTTRTQILETGSVYTRTLKCFDIEYEMLSGDLLAAWGTTSEGIKYATLKASSTIWSDNITFEPETSGTDYVTLLDLAADPGSSRICVVVVNDNSRDLEGAIWTGTAWTDGQNLEGDVFPFASSGQFNIAAGWAGPSGKALAIYENDNGDINWDWWTESSGWSARPNHLFPGSTELDSMQPFTYFDETKLILLVSDSNDDLYAFTTDGTSWTTTNGGSALEFNLSTDAGVPFFLDSYGQTALLLSDHRVGQRSERFESGASSGANLFNFLLKPREGLPKTVNSLVFQLTNVSGILDSDLIDSSFSIVVDADEDGIADPGETTTIGGTPNVSLSGTTGTITFSSSFDISDFTYLILTGNVLNLTDGDAMTISLTTSDINVTGDTVIRGQVTSLPLVQGGSRLSGHGDTRLLYAQGNSPSDVIRSRIIDGSDFSVSSEGLTTSSNAIVQWMEHAVHHDGQQELLVQQSTFGPTIEVIRFNGQDWVDDWSVTGLSSSHIEKRAFDVVYESLSGNGLVVYSDGTNSPKFRSFLSSANTWGPETPVYASGAAGGVVRWVELAAQSGNNQVALAFSDEDNDLYCIVWDGTGWRSSTNTILETSLRSQETKMFDLAYEDLSGDLMVIWGDGGDDMSYATLGYESTSWSGKLTEPRNALSDADIENVEMEPLAGTDNIGVVMYTDGRDWNGGIWTGDVFFDFENEDGDMGSLTETRMMIESGWVEPEGTFVIVARDSTATGRIQTSRWKAPGGWSSTFRYDTDYTGIPISFDVVTLEGQNKTLISFLDDDGKLFLHHYDGTTFSDVGDKIQSSSVINTEGRAHQLGVHNPTRAMVTDISAGVVQNGFSNTGSENQTELLSFRLLGHGGTFTVNHLVVDIVSTTGIQAADLNGFRLMVDEDRDGVLDAGETTSLGSGNLDFNDIGGVGNIFFGSSITLDGPKHLILTGNVLSLVEGDSMSVSMKGSGLSSTADRVLGETSQAVHYEGTIGPNDIGDIRLLYYREGLSTLRTRLWDHSTLTLGDETDGPNPTMTTKWLAHDLDPNSSKEHVAVQVSDESNTQIEIFTYDGSSWASGFTDSSISNSYRNYRGFDMVTMTKSGNAICVFSDNDGNPHYTVYDGTSWSAEQNVLASSSAGTVIWVDLAAQPGSDEVGLVFSDSNSDLYAVVWNGSSWDAAGNVKMADDLDSITEKCFDIEYESISGDLMVVWGSDSRDGFFWSKKERGSSTFSSNVQEEFGFGEGLENNRSDPVRHVDITPHPSSDAMVYTGFEDTNASGGGLDNHNASIWTGDTWVSHQRIEGTERMSNGTRDTAIFAHGSWLSQSDVPQSYWRYRNRTGWEGEDWEYGIWSAFTTLTKEEGTSFYNKYNMTALSHPTEDFVAVMWNDITNTNEPDRIFFATRTSPTGSWTLENNGTELGTFADAMVTRTFNMSMRFPKMALLANHSENQVPDAFSENGGESSANLFAFSIRASRGENTDVSSIVFRVDDISGISSSDIGPAFLYLDENNNGVKDAGETTTLGGQGVVSLGASTGTITFSDNFLLNEEKQLILQTSASNLNTGDRLDLTLSESDITVANGSCVGEVFGVTHLEVGGQAPRINGDGRFIYGTRTSDASMIRSRIYGSDGDLMTEPSPLGRGLASPIDMRLEISPVNPDLEIALSYSGTGNMTELAAFRWTGTEWQKDWSMDRMPWWNNPYRGFDLAFAAQSGNALAVYADNTQNLKYREFNAGTMSWESESSVFNADVGGEIRWVALAPNSGNNQIGLALADDQLDLHIGLWNEGTWGANNLDVETNMNWVDNESFAIAFEDVSGNLLAVWGRNNGNEVGYSTMVFGSNTWVTTNMSVGDDQPVGMDIASEPGSDNIMVVYHSENSANDMQGGIWQDGFTWTQLYTDTLRTNDAQFFDGIMIMGAGWMGPGGGRAMAFYDAHNTQTDVRGYEWVASTATWTSKTFPIVANNDTRNVRVRTLKNSDAMMLMLADDNEHLYTFKYGFNESGSIELKFLNDSTIVDSQVSTFKGVPFDFAERSGPQLVLANHPAGQVIDAFTGTGSANARLFAFQLTPSVGSLTVSDVTLTTSSNSGLVNGDFADLQLYTDSDGDGQIEAGDTSVGGTATMDLATGSLNFDGDFTVTGASSFVVSANFSSLSEGDALTLGLASTNIILTTNSPVSGEVLSASHYEESLSNLPEEGIRLIYDTSGNNNLYSRVFVTANTQWTDEELLISANATSETGTINLAIDPKGQRTSVQIFSSNVSPAPTSNEFSLFHNDGLAWLEAVSQKDSETYMHYASRDELPYALAYESLSGNAVAISANSLNRNGILWYTLSGNTWTNRGNLDQATNAYNEDLYWARMYSHPDRNEITLMMAYNNEITVMIWDGSTETWTDPKLLEDDYEDNAHMTFSGAYENMSGDFLAVWGAQNPVNALLYSTRSDGATTWSDNIVLNYTNIGRVYEFSVVPEPATDRIAVFCYDHEPDLIGGIWTGKSFVDLVQLDSSNRRGTGFWPLGGEWIGDTGKFLSVYYDDDGGDTIGYTTWSETEGYVRPSPPNMGLSITDAQNIKLFSLDPSDQVLILAHTSGDNLYSYTYNGTDFLPYDSETPIVTNLENGASVRSWDAVQRKGPRLFVAERESGPIGDAFAENGSLSDNALIAFRLKATQGETISVSELVFDLENITGVSVGDIQDLKIFVDRNDDGNYDSGDTTQVGGDGVASVSGVEGSITFDDDFSVTGTNTFFLRADVLLLAEGDRLDIKLDGDDVLSPRIVQGSTTSVEHIEEGASPVTAGNLRVVYATRNEPGRVLTRIRNDDTDSWEPEISLPDIGHDSLWMSHQFGINGEEFIASQGYSDGGFELGVLQLSGNVWSKAWSTSANNYVNWARKTFDLAVESVSGNAMVVWADDDNNPSYRYWNGSTWSAAAPVFTTAPGGPVEYVRLQAAPFDNRIGLVYNDQNSNKQLHAVIWSGTTWLESTTEITLEPDMQYTSHKRAFDLAFESLTGDMLVVWGNDATNGMFHREFSYASNTWLDEKIYNEDNENHQQEMVLLQSHPTQDWILVYTENTDNRSETAIWTGNTMSLGTQAQNVLTLTNGEFLLGASWIGTSTRAFFYTITTVGGTFTHSRYNRINSTLIDYLTNIGRGESLDSINLPFKGLGYLLHLDQDEDLNGVFHDGTDFYRDGTENIAEGIIGTDTMPADVSVKLPEMVRFSNHPAEFFPDPFGESSSVNDVSLMAFRITPILGATTIDSITINVGGDGIQTSDLQDMWLRVDSNGDGIISGGETTSQVGGGGNFAIFNDVGTMTFDETFTLTESKLLVLQADVSNLVEGDFMTLTLDGSNASVSQLGGTYTFHHRHGSNPIEKQGDGLIAYSVGKGDKHSSLMRYRWFDTETNRFSPELHMPSSNAYTRFVDAEISPSTNQVTVVTQGTFQGEGASGSTGTQVYRFDGSRWKLELQNWDLDVSGDENRFSADGCYASLSGNAIVVFSDDTNSPKFWEFNASANTWTSEAAVTGTPLGSSPVEWVRVEPRPGSNDVMLAYADSNERLYTILYRNGAWDDSTRLEVSTALDSEDDDLRNLPMDMAWETLSGQLLLVYGNLNQAGLHRTTFDPHTKTYNTLGPLTTISDIHDAEIPKVEAAPNSDQIIVSYREEDNDQSDWIWTGNAFTAFYRPVGGRDAYDYTRPLDNTWFGTEGKAFSFFDDESSGTVKASTYDIETGFVLTYGPDWSTSTTTDVIHSADGMYHEDEVLLAMVDSDFILHSFIYDGSSVEWLNGEEPLTDMVADRYATPMDQVLAQRPAVLFGDHIEDQALNALGTGSSSNVVLGKLQFKVRNGQDQTLSNVVFDLSNLIGVEASDFDNVFLVWDEDKDGVIDAGETSTIGGEGSVTVSGSSGNIAFTTSIVVGEERFYLLQADVSNMVAGDQVVIGLSSSGVTPSSSAVDAMGDVSKMSHKVGSLGVGDIRIPFGSYSGSRNIQILTYDASESSWRTEKGPSGVGIVNHLKHEFSPLSYEEEMIVTMSTVVNDTNRFDAYRKTSSGWVSDWAATGIDWDSNAYYRRLFDFAYCQLSGNALVVYSDDDTNPSYRVFNAATDTWSGAADVLGTPLGNTADWIKMVSKPKSDEIFVMIADQDEDLTVVFFDGDNFLPATELEVETTLQNDSNQLRVPPFDAAYESLSGDLVFVWDDETDGFNYRTMKEGTLVWEDEIAVTYTNDDAFRNLKLEPDPKTDMILLIGYMDSNNIEGGVWTGAEWTNLKELNNNGTPFNNTLGTSNFAAAWVESGRWAINWYNFASSATTNNYLYWRTDTIDNFNGYTSSTFTMSARDNWVNMAGVSYKSQDKALFVAHDKDRDFHAFHVESNTWTQFYDGNNTDEIIDDFYFSPWDVSIIDPVILFEDHPLGAEPSSLEVDPLEFDVELLRFRASIDGSGDNLAMEPLVIDLSSVEGVKGINLTNPRLYVDSNSDGDLSLAELTASLGTGTVKMDVGTPTGNIVFNSGISFSREVKDYILVADMFNIEAGDGFAINVNPGYSRTALGTGIGRASGSYHRTDKATLSSNGDVRIVWGQLGPGSGTPRTVTFDASTNTLSSSYGLVSGNSGILNVSNAVSPINHHEVVVTGSGQDGGGNISVMQNNGGVWENSFWAGGFDSDQIDYRGFDVAYSQISGNALVVYGGDGNNPHYRVHNSSANTWGAENTIALGNDEVAWVELVSKPNSNEIALIWMDMSKELYGSIWDGENWTDSQSLDTNLYDLGNKCFDAAYEADDGDLVVCWGINNTNGLFYAIYSGGSWGATSSYTTNQNRPETLDMAAAPSGNTILIVYDGGQDQRMRGAEWNGTSFTNGRDIDGGFQRPNEGNFYPTVAWRTDDQAVFVYDDDISNSTQTLDWWTYTPSSSTWSYKTPVTISGTSFFAHMRAMNMSDGRIFVAGVTREHEVWFFTYDGSVWLRHIPADGTPTMVGIRSMFMNLSAKGGLE